MKNYMKKFWGSLAILLATILWGGAFSAQSKSTEFVDPWLFIALRSLTAAVTLPLVVIFLDLLKLRRLTLWGNAQTEQQQKQLLTGGVLCGIILAAASLLQQYGIQYTSVGKTGFLTALYIIIVPIIGTFFKHKVSFLMWIAVGLGMFGAYLLCGGISNINLGEWMVIVGALFYSLHILVIDKYAAICDCVRLSTIQFAVAAFFSLLLSALLSTTWQWHNIYQSLPFWIFCGAFSGAAAFTLQMVAQKYLHPVTVTLLMSLESVFAVLGGWIFLREWLTPREIAGCTVIFVSVILAQLPKNE